MEKELESSVRDGVAGDEEAKRGLELQVSGLRRPHFEDRQLESGDREQVISRLAVPRHERPSDDFALAEIGRHGAEPTEHAAIGFGFGGES